MPRGFNPTLQDFLLRFLVRLRFFFRRLLLFRLVRRGRRVLLWLCPWCRRSPAFGLRRLARRRSHGPLGWLTPVRLWPIIRLDYGRMIRLGLSFRLRCGLSARFRFIWLRLVWPCGRRTVRLRLVRRSRPIRTASILWMRDWCVDCRLNRRTIHWRVVRRPGLFRMDNGAVTECPRLRSSSDGWRTMVHGSSLLWIRAGGLLMLRLSGHGRDVPLVCR